MNRYSVLYLLREQYYHIGCATQEEAKALLQHLSASTKRTSIGIYDAKSELFEWETALQQSYNQADIEEQGKRGEQIITIAQSLRRRDSSWHPAVGFQRPSFFA